MVSIENHLVSYFLACVAGGLVLGRKVGLLVSPQSLLFARVQYGAGSSKYNPIPDFSAPNTRHIWRRIE